jgi:hypothetical protein
VKERGILFSAPMVRALLAGTKTQTRRLVKHRQFGASDTRGYDWTFRATPRRGGCWNDVSHARMLELCPYGAPGDRLWVRETWQAWNRVSVEYDEWEPITREARSGERWASWIELRGRPDSIEYRATSESTGPWTPAIHMPRWASRITLEIAAVRVERLQVITEGDAIAEGLEVGPFPGERPVTARVPGESVFAEPRMVYAHLWDTIHGEGAWDANPWVWVVEFRRMTPA